MANRKKEIKRSLYVSDTIFYEDHPKESTRNPNSKNKLIQQGQRTQDKHKNQLFFYMLTMNMCMIKLKIQFTIA